MKRQLRSLILATLAATALGAGAGWAWSSLTPAPAPAKDIVPVADGPQCSSGQCCTLSIAAESLLSGARSQPAAASECCEPDVRP